MDGLARMAGAGCSFTINGKTRRVDPLRLRHFGEIEHLLLFHRPANPSREVGKVLPRLEIINQKLAEDLRERAIADLRKDKGARVVREDELFTWAYTAYGLSYTAWCCLRESPPGCIYLEDAMEILSKMDADDLIEFVRLRDQISGIDLLASADWVDTFANVRPETRKRRMASSRKQFYQWRRNFYAWGINCGYTEESIGNWTLYQARVYSTSEEDLGLKSKEVDSEPTPKRGR